jgi:hypothetical protein
MTNIAFPFEQAECDSLENLVERYALLPGYFSMNRQKILRMIVAGGILSLKEQPTGVARPAIPSEFESCLVTSSEVEDIETIMNIHGLSHEQALRCVVIDGLAYVEKALVDFQTAKISYSSHPGTNSN